MMRAETTTPAVAAACSAAVGAKNKPGAAERMPSTETIMVSHKPRPEIIEKLAQALGVELSELVKAS